MRVIIRYQEGGELHHSPIVDCASLTVELSDGSKYRVDEIGLKKRPKALIVRTENGKQLAMAPARNDGVALFPAEILV